MFLCPSHHLSSLSTKSINQELQLFRGLTSYCSFWSHHFFDSAENFNISWAKGKFSEVPFCHSVSHQNFWDIWTFPTWRPWGRFWDFFGLAGAQEMVLQGDVSDWLPGSQVAISATEYPSPPQTTETEVWLGMAGMAAKRSLFFWGKCFAKIFWTNPRLFLPTRKEKKRSHARDRRYAYHPNTRARCLRFPECPTRPGHYKTIHDATCAADFALVWWRHPNGWLLLPLNCFMILDV